MKKNNEEIKERLMKARALSDEDLTRVTGGIANDRRCPRGIIGASPNGECSFYDPNKYICVVDCKDGEQTSSSIEQNPQDPYDGK